MDSDQLKHEILDKVEGAYQTLDETIESISPHAATLLREANERYLVIRSANGQVILRARLSLVFLYALAMLRIRELRWGTLLALPIMLSRLQFAVEQAPDSADTMQEVTNITAPKKNKSRANGTS